MIHAQSPNGRRVSSGGPAHREGGSHQLARSWAVMRTLGRRMAGADRRSRVRARDFLSAPGSGGGVVALHVPTGTYLRLDPAAARILQLLFSEGDEARAAAQLARRLQIPGDQAERDVAHVAAAVRALSRSRATGGRRPTLRGGMAELRRWRSLPRGRRRAACSATVIVATVELGLRFCRIERLAWLLGVPVDATPADPPPAGTDDVGDLSPDELVSCWAVDWVLGRWTYDATCLRRSLALGFVLRKRHPRLRLGLMEDGVTAHAWVVGTRFVVNASTVATVFSAGPPEPSGRPVPADRPADRAAAT